MLNARCSGITRRRDFRPKWGDLPVTLEFSGQPAFDPKSAERLTFKTNDVDGTLTAVNNSTQTTIAAAALSALEEIEGADGDGIKGDGNYAFTGTGKAWVNGITTAIAVRISFNKANDLTRVAITMPAETEFYAGGTTKTTESSSTKKGAPFAPKPPSTIRVTSESASY